MRKVGLKTWIYLGLSLLCAALAFGRCYAGRNHEVTLPMLINSGLSLPYAGEQNLLAVTRCCLTHSASWLEQVIFYGMHHDGVFRDTGSIYVVYAVGAFLACLLAFRVGSSCVCPGVGLLASFFLACMPLDLWANCAFTAAIVLFNWDRLLAALKFNTYMAWTLYMLSTLVMFFNCFYTETVVLQWWFGAQLAALLIRMLLVGRTHRSPHFSSADIAPRVLVREERGEQEVYVFLGVLLFSWAALTVLFTILCSFAASGNLYMSTFFKVILSNLALVLLLGGIYLAMPLSDSLRKQFKKYLSRVCSRIFSQSPDRTFFFLRGQHLGLALAVFALAIAFFSPFVLKVYKDRMDFSMAEGVASYWRLADDTTPWQFWAPITPLVAALLALVLRRLRHLTSAEACGIVSVALFAALFIFQRRYAAISAPFFAISAFSVPFMLLRASGNLLREVRPEREEQPRTTEAADA